MSTSIQTWTLESALALVRAGLSLIPVSGQTKRPIEALLPQDPDTGLGSWKPYQLRLPTLDEIKLWLDAGAQLALVCGSVSGNLRCIDLDIVRFYQLWRGALGNLADGLVIQQTGGGGYQAFFRCPNPGGNEKLAWEADANEPSGRQIAVETRGEGGYAIIAPSLHPSGNSYVLLEGNFTVIPDLSQAHADALSDAARRLDEAPYTRQQLDAMKAAMQQPSRHQATLNGSGSVIEAYNHSVSIEEALQRYGYTLRFSNRWARPGGTNPSVKVEQGKSYHHNTNDPLSDNHWHDAFDLFTLYEHSGDAKSAARAAATILCLPPAIHLPPGGNTAGVTPMPLPAAPAPSALQLLADANLTDAGNAECLAALYGDHLRYCHSRKLWLVWDGQRWQENHDGIAHRFALAIARARYQAAPGAGSSRSKDLAGFALRCENVRLISSMLQSASTHMQFATTLDRYDQDPFLASTPTGTLDLRAGQLRPANPDDYISMQMGAAYDPSATCPRWLQFIDEIFAGDADLIAYVQRAVGYSLTGDTREQKLFLCHGEGANGKGRFFTIVSALLGDYAGYTNFSTFDAEQVNPTGEDVASLRGKRFVSLSENEQDRRLNEAKAKQLTGQDPISCRHLYGHRFSYIPNFKIWLAMNHLPIVRGDDRGIWRRIALVPFTQSFEANPDQTLEQKLLAELSGVLNWALDGLCAWQQQGLGSCPAVEHATEEYRAASDKVGLWLREETIGDPAGMLGSTEAYQSYLLWSKNRGERYPITQNAWGRSIAKKYKTITPRPRIDGKYTTAYGGIRLREDTDPDLPSVPAVSAGAAQAPAAQPPQSDYDHDRQRQLEAQQLARDGKFDRARQKAQAIRSNKQQAALTAWIGRVERGEIAIDDPIA